MSNDESPQGGTVPDTAQTEAATPDSTPKPRTRAPRKPKVVPAETPIDTVAEVPAPVAEKPKRVSRPRKLTASETVQTDVELVKEVAVPITPAKPRPTRSRRGKEAEASKSSESENSEPTLDLQIDNSSAGLKQAHNGEQVEATEPLVATEKPTKKRPQRRQNNNRAKTVDEVTATVQELLSSPTAEVSQTEVDNSEPATLAAEPTTAPPSRRRRGRGRPNAAATTGETTGESTSPDALSSEAPLQAVADSAEPASAPEQTRRPSRRSRSGRPGQGNNQKQPVAEIVAVSESPAPPPPPPPIVVDITKGAHVVVRNGGHPELLINGMPTSPIFFFGNLESAKEARQVVSEIKRAASAGVHLYSTLVELTCPIPADDTVYEALDSRIATILDADPAGYVMPRIVFVPAPGWRKQYPNEVNHYTDGTTDDPSIASTLFWDEAERALESMVDHIKRMKYGQRIIGYHLERGEWFHPKDGGFDKSYANREAFRQWLRTKYNSNESSLRASWYDGQVQFYTAEIPPVPTATKSEMAFYEPRKERRLVDFLEYTSDIVAERLVKLAGSIKRASGREALVSVCYGYTFEFTHAFSGHLALSKVLTSNDVDIISGPPSYRDRLPGGAGSLPGPTHSMAVHGKLWISEDDTKTYLAPVVKGSDDFNPQIESRFWTDQVHQRAMGKALANQSGIAFMDIWGEGWLDASELWDKIGQFQGRYATTSAGAKTTTPEVVVLIDEKSLIHLQRGEAFFTKLLTDQRDIFQKLGASVGFYLQNDVTAERFPTDAKLYIFLNPYRLTNEQRIAVKEKLHSNRKTVVWTYSPGVCTTQGEPEDYPNDTVGFTLRHQPWNSEIGTRIVETRHPVTELIQSRFLGAKERLNPSFFVDNDSGKFLTLGEYQQSGLPSLASKDHGPWISVFMGEPLYTLELLRGLCKFAGVHLYLSEGDDFLTAGGGWITLHAPRDGYRVVRFPGNCAVYDITEGRYLGDSLREYRFFQKAKTTHIYYAGTKARILEMGLSTEDRPIRGRRRGPNGHEIGDTDAAEPNLEETTRPDSQTTETLADAEVKAHDIDKTDETATGDVSDPFQVTTTGIGSEDDRLGEIFHVEADGEGLEITEADTDPDTEDAAQPGRPPLSKEEEEARRRRRRRGGRGRGRRPTSGGGSGPA